MALDAMFADVVTNVTPAGTGAAKMVILIQQYSAAMLKEMSRNNVITPNMREHWENAQGNIEINAADIATAFAANLS